MAKGQAFTAKVLVILAIPAIIWFLPAPAGLSLPAWHIFSIYIGAILGLILRPFSEPVVILGAVAAAGIFLNGSGQVLMGYANRTTWLVFCAMLISVAFIETGLGRRIAFALIGKIGRTSLGLGYAATLLDVILAPGIPSNTARDGGIIFPIMRSISVTLGSEPGATSRKVGSYLVYLVYVLSSTSSYLFLTAMAPNILVVQFAQSILGIKVDWIGWFVAASVPALTLLLLLPYLLLQIFPPKLRTLDNKSIAEKGFAEMGPMSVKEKGLIMLFALAILGWITGNYTGILATDIALVVTVGCLFLNIITWDHILGSKGAWSTFIWYGGIIGLAETLSKAKFFEWLAKSVASYGGLSSIDPIAALVALILMSIVIRYVFASGGAYVAAMIPVFFTLGAAVNAPAYPLFFGIAFSLGYASMLTHYGSGVAPVVFGAGYLDQATWWKVGTILVAVSFLVNTVVGMLWWKFLGLW